MATYKKWNQTELQYIQDNLSNFTDKELSLKLSEMTSETISPSMIRRQRRKLGVQKTRGRKSKKNNTAINNENGVVQ